MPGAGCVAHADSAAVLRGIIPRNDCRRVYNVGLVAVSCFCAACEETREAL